MSAARISFCPPRLCKAGAQKMLGPEAGGGPESCGGARREPSCAAIFPAAMAAAVMKRAKKYERAEVMVRRFSVSIFVT